MLWRHNGCTEGVPVHGSLMLANLDSGVDDNPNPEYFFTVCPEKVGVDIGNSCYDLNHQTLVHECRSLLLLPFPAL